MCLAFLLFLFWNELWRSKVKGSMLLNKDKNFNKNQTESKMENPFDKSWDIPCGVSARIRIGN